MMANLFKHHPSPFMLAHLQSVFCTLDEDALSVRIQEFLRFIYLQSLKDGGFIPVTDEIDQIWHEYILQTREYLALCNDLPHAQFVHHQTATLATYIQTRNRKEVIQDMLMWIPTYVETFGKFTEKTAPYWTIVQFLLKHTSLTLSQLNSITFR
ncbi:MAG: hypothetical protein CK426_03375 [Legionella sp.]|nr:MAG: hypothetical protein CK423_06120 [Legionella sp.]PJD99214.1 MAG: hypothetical protein CK426_03375 [Legionella sp.]